MHIAAINGDLKRLRQLIEAGVPVDSLNEEGQTPLHTAVTAARICFGQYEVAALLINSKCNINLKDRHGCTPVMLAAAFGRKNIVDLLLHLGAQVNCVDYNKGCTLLHHASYYGWTDIVRLILDNGEADRDGSTVNLKDRNGHTPLMCAAYSGEKKIVDLLLHRGALVNCDDSYGPSLLRCASARGWADIVRLILDTGEADLNTVSKCGETPLMCAARERNEEIAVLLIRAGADVNRSDIHKNTALHWAVKWGSTRVMHVLLEKEGLDLSPQDAYGNTPLHLACQRTYREAIKQLLGAGANTNLRNNQGKTALSEGIRREDLTHEEIRLFVQKGAFLENFDYKCIFQQPFLKENVLKDVELCTLSVVNKFNCQSLPALYSIAYLARRLPNVDKFKLRARHKDEVENLVKCEIEKNAFCNVVKVHPIALSALCVLSLITCHSGKKRAASPDFDHSLFKKIHN